MAKLHLAQEIYDLMYPVGSVYESFSSTDPSSLFGGTWKQFYNGYEVRYVGSQSIYSECVLSENSSKVLAGAYGTGLFDALSGMMPSNDVNLGYLGVYYVISCEFSTSGSCKASLFLNDTEMISNLTTWSGTDYRAAARSAMFHTSDVPQRKLSNYSGNGYEIKVSVSGSGDAKFYNVTMHCYFKASIKKYKWRRTA